MKSLLALILLVLLPSFATLAWAEPETIPGDKPAAAVTAILDSMSPSSNEPLYTQQTQPSQQSSTAMDYRLRQEENRFRLIVNAVEVVPPDAALPKLPTARAVWIPKPSLKVAAALL